MAGLMAQEGVLERHMMIGRVQPHRFGELVASLLGETHLEQGVSEVLANGGAPRLEGDSLAKTLYCRLVSGLLELLVG